MQSESGQTESKVSPPPDCPLPPATQTRNLLIFAANWALIYFASPVTYVGVIQATLVDRLGFTNKEANLPAGVYLWTTPLAVLILCRFPQTRMIKPMIVGAFLATAAMGLVVTLVLLSENLVENRIWLLTTLIVYAIVWGAGNGLVAACQWEMIGRGVSASRRGLALGLAFGVGPAFAVIASLVSQSLLGGAAASLRLPFVPRIDFPWSFAVLYGASVPIMLMAAFLSSLYVTVQPAVEPLRPPWLTSVFGGLGDFIRDRLLRLATIAYLLVYSGHEVLQNLSLYAKVVLGGEPSDYAGAQMAMRFGFKIFAGFALAWLLVVSNPRTLLIATASLTMAAVAWTLALPEMYLISFGILGAGELFGVYYLNYVERSSRPGQIRRNIGFASMATMLVGFAPITYGAISDTFARRDLPMAAAQVTAQIFPAPLAAPVGAAWPQQTAAFGVLQAAPFTPGKRLGFQMSFIASITVLIVTIVLVAALLPKNPRPAEGATGRGPPGSGLPESGPAAEHPAK